MQVQSAPDQGSAFHFTLPAAAERCREKPGEPSGAGPSRRPSGSTGQRWTDTTGLTVGEDGMITVESGLGTAQTDLSSPAGLPSI
ncbi:hypothetical protein GCM10010844_28660 [Deinococcus radiotolerans]|uniref:Uncharacterized protein n=1 Tax=Deinococcus radiotolerans TaxID=1309407 RepID=A0ABQ2FMF7_9DEIO|nr:hypothetical protein GCM10010844_28660 [Deinococcus radiotolerans]